MGDINNLNEYFEVYLGVYLYELTEKSFKEKKVNVKVNGPKSATVYYTTPDGLTKLVSPTEGEIYKGKVWFKKRDKKAAADLFKYALEKDRIKAEKKLNSVNDKLNMLDKYYSNK